MNGARVVGASWSNQQGSASYKLGWIKALNTLLSHQEEDHMVLMELCYGI